jgi:hypothetical protein
MGGNRAPYNILVSKPEGIGQFEDLGVSVEKRLKLVLKRTKCENVYRIQLAHEADYCGFCVIRNLLAIF